MLVAFLARAPQAMMPLGLMTAFTAASGDIAIGGLATGVFSVATAIFSPLVGRAADLWGQRRILVILTPINALGMLSLYWAAHNGYYTGLVWVLWLVTGATAIPVGSFARARWVAANPGPRILSAAFSYESMADELVFVLGPALVGIAASASAPTAPLLLAFVLALVAGMPFALKAPAHSLEAASDAATNLAARPPIRKVIVAVIPAIFALIFVGSFFGSVQAGTTARAASLGAEGSAGLIYATMGLGSAVAALLVVTLPAKFRLSYRFILFGIGMAVTIFIAGNQHALTALTLVLLASGFFVGPTLVTAFTAAEKLAPSGGISVAMTLMQSSVTIGVSVGSAGGGALAENAGAFAAFLMSTAAGVGITIIGLLLLFPHYRAKHYLI